MSLNPAFCGHGVFCYQPLETMVHFSGYPIPDGTAPATGPNDFAGAIAAFKDMGISNVWIRLFGHEGPMPLDDAALLVAALRRASIGVAGWGYSHGDDWQADLKIALDHSDQLGLDAFVADIEPGRTLDGTVSKWRMRDINFFVDGLVSHFGKDNVGVSTWPVLKIQTSHSIPTLDLMRSIADKIAFFAPQAYWMRYPDSVHYDTTGLSEHEFPRNDPSSFVRLVLRSWRADGFTNKISITGQGYWGEGGGPPQSVIERKITDFALRFTDWQQIIGLNWWHAGNRHAMSFKMVAAIADGRFQSKPFNQENAPIS